MTKQEAIIELTADMKLTLFDPVTGEVVTPEELKCKSEEAYKIYKAEEIAIRALHFSIRAERWLQEDEEENRK